MDPTNIVGFPTPLFNKREHMSTMDIVSIPLIFDLARIEGLLSQEEKNDEFS